MHGAANVEKSMTDFLGDDGREAVLRILSNALMYARSYAFQNCAKECEIEIDHVHNLPSILIEPTRERLSYYMRIEVPIYISKTGDWSSLFEPSWAVLRSKLLE